MNGAVGRTMARPAGTGTDIPDGLRDKRPDGVSFPQSRRKCSRLAPDISRVDLGGVAGLFEKIHEISGLAPGKNRTLIYGSIGRHMSAITKKESIADVSSAHGTYN